MAIEIVDLPIQREDFSQLFVCLPEGMSPHKILISQRDCLPMKSPHFTDRWMDGWRDGSLKINGGFQSLASPWLLKNTTMIV